MLVMLTSSDALHLVWTQAWQVAVVALLVLAAVRIWGRTRPHLAHALWLVVLCKCLTPPLIASPVGVFSWLDRIRTASPTDNTRSVLEPVPQRALGSQKSVDHVVEVQHDKPTGQPLHAPNKPPKTFASSLQLAVGQLAQRCARFGLGRVFAAIAGIWIVGAVAKLALLATRWVTYSRHLHRQRAEVPIELAARVERLTRKLKLRRPVRLLVTGSPLGPAVIGLFRPTIVLPTLLTDRMSADELEPILAHELLHVRRGDLAISCLQAIGGVAWWFHPLVALAGRRLAREAERCCDEEVLAELCCAPAHYARGLLAVLELKRTLLAAPAFPGVRAVDLTKQRLERIMSLGQGCHRRTPWWCWTAMLLLATVVLPGAGMLVAADDLTTAEPNVAEPRTAEPAVPDAYAPRPVSKVRNEADPLATSSVPGNARPPVWNHSADVSDLLTAVKKQRRLNDRTARQFLLEQLYNRAAARVAQRTSDESIDLHLHEVTADGLLVGPKESAESKRWRIQIDANAALRVEPAAGVSALAQRSTDRTSFDGLAHLEQALAEMREFGFRSVELTVRFAVGPAEVIEAASSKWTLTAGPDDARSTDSHQEESIPLDPLPAIPKWAPLGDNRPGLAHAHVAIEQEVPVLFEVIDEARLTSLLDRFESARQANVVQAPRVTMFSGQSASVADVTQTPFVVGLRELAGALDVALEPQIRIVRSGLWLHARPIVRDEVVHLDFEFTLSGVKEVKSQQMPTKAGPAEVQIPVVARTRFQSTVDLPLGKTLLMGGLKRATAKGDEESVLVLLTAREVEAQSAAKLNKPDESAQGVNSNGGEVGDTANDAATLPQPDDATAQQARERRQNLGLTAMHRRAAAARQLHVVAETYREGKVELDLLLETQRRFTDSELSAVEYEFDEADADQQADRNVRLAKRKLEILCSARDRALKTWRDIYLLYVTGSQGGSSQNELQAREQYFLYRKQVEMALAEFNAARTSSIAFYVGDTR
jgi:beta-lactamase regulating signal transducer with metallopeptidase domain